MCDPVLHLNTVCLAECAKYRNLNWSTVFVWYKLCVVCPESQLLGFLLVNGVLLVVVFGQVFHGNA